MMLLRLLATCAALTAAAAPAHAQLSVPAYSSRPGAAYTMYLNFGGFNYTGNWGASTPGVTPAYNTDGNAAAFSAAELTNIRVIWARTAEKYSAYNVNVTTADAAAPGATDAQRKAFYDATPRFMHTVVGGAGAWSGGGGVSYVGVAQNAVSAGSGFHTNWAFSQQFSTAKQVAEVTAHEDGNALRLSHQGRINANGTYTTYDPGTSLRAPIMGNSYSAERGLWRRGVINSSGALQNDAGRLLTNAGIAGNGVAGFMDSGKGHTIGTATPLTFTGTAINSSATAGIITPNTSTDPNPLGELNYTTDYFTFTVGAGGANLAVVLRSGRSTIAAGVADPGATLDATLRLLNATGAQVAISNSGVFTETITQNNLAPGVYYLRVSSAGADSQYFDMGSYFLTGTLTPVPEPGAALAVGAVTFLAWRVRRRGRLATG